MDHQPEQSIGFQKFMSQVLAAGAEAVAAAIPKTCNGGVCQLAKELGDLRTQFVSSQFEELVLYDVSLSGRDALAHQHQLRQERVAAYSAYSALRDTVEAQAFISENPNFLSSIDHALFRCVVSIRKTSAQPAK